MKLLKENRIDLIISKDATRPHLASAYLDLDGPSPVLVATDGHRLVKLPVKACDGDTTGFVTGEALKAGRQSVRKGEEFSISANESLYVQNGPTFPRPTDATAGCFPPYSKVIPGKRDTVSICLNAHYLWELAQALGADKFGGVVIEFNPAGPMDPIVVKRGTKEDDAGGIGVLMPMRY